MLPENSPEFRVPPPAFRSMYSELEAYQPLEILGSKERLPNSPPVGHGQCLANCGQRTQRDPQHGISDMPPVSYGFMEILFSTTPGVGDVDEVLQ